MQDLVDKLHQLRFQKTIQPGMLLDNARLENYEYVNYYKNVTGGLTCEMKCKMDDMMVVFYYHFDANDYLQLIEQKNPRAKKKVVFDRGQKIDDVYQEADKRKKIASEQELLFS